MKRQLDEDVTKGILEPVPVGETTEWCARMLVVAKKLLRLETRIIWLPSSKSSGAIEVNMLTCYKVWKWP